LSKLLDQESFITRLVLAVAALGERGSLLPAVQRYFQRFFDEPDACRRKKSQLESIAWRVMSEATTGTPPRTSRHGMRRHMPHVRAVW
jgi:hypothetical protein